MLIEHDYDGFGCLSPSGGQFDIFPPLYFRANCTVKVLKADKSHGELSASHFEFSAPGQCPMIS